MRSSTVPPVEIQEKHKLHQAMRTSSDIKVGKDRIFKKYLNVGYPRTFIYSLLNAPDEISTH